MDTNTVMAAETVYEDAGFIETVKTMGIDYGFRVLGAVVILVVGFWVVRMLQKLLEKGMEHQKVDDTLVGFVSSLAHIGMKIAVIIAALEALQVKTASLIALLGAAGLAIGLALQGSLSNFAAGVLMIIFKPIKLKDYVEINGVTGTVQQIGILTTELDTLDNKHVVVANANVLSANIINYTYNDTRRVDLVAGISYGDDIDKARAAIEEVFAATDKILEHPKPSILVNAMADSSVNFSVRPWCKAGDYWAVYYSVTEGIKKKFDERGITIPFPQRDVHLYEHKGE
ncbi:mechanosensitive ion channel family protein [Pontiella sp.]|uniref:mechanosensitive ion channel family protein n=1 Tax=Pontiella sp. TaxID=2837462 RepID=UPI00356A51EB